MNIEANYRHDPLYRIINNTLEMQMIEKNLRVYFERLKKINSLGLVPEIIEKAKYPKYEHAIGTIHQINSLIEINQLSHRQSIIEKYYRPLKISAEFLHLGHFPFTYSTERALLLAFIISDTEKIKNDKEKLKVKIEKLLPFLEIDSKEKLDFVEKIFSIKDFKFLYKVFSSHILLENWNVFFKKFNGEKLTEDDKKIMINNIINDDCVGYHYLDLADRTDFVQRDALYFGTIKIDISPKHLYPNALANIFEVSAEEDFLYHNLHYLTESFYKTPEVVCFSRLYEKIVAALIQSEHFKIEWLVNYDDDSFKWLITASKDKENKKIKFPEEWIDRADKLFKKQLSFIQIFKIDGVQLSSKISIIDIEHELIGKENPKKYILSYPFETGTLISIDSSEIELFDDTEYLLSPNGQISETEYLDICVYQNKKQNDLSELLKIISNLSKYLSPTDQKKVREGLSDLLSRTGKHTIKNTAVLKSIAEAIAIIDKKQPTSEIFIIDYINILSRNSEFDELWKKPDLVAWKEMIFPQLKTYIEDPGFDKIDAFARIFQDILDLPIKLLQSESSKQYLTKISETLLNLVRDPEDKDLRGNYFEALCLIEKIINPKGLFQIFINGHTVVDPAQKSDTDKNEYDILELRLNDNNKAELWIYSCSISTGIEGGNKNQLNLLYNNIRKKFPNLIIRTRYCVPENRSRKKWMPQLKESGLNSN